MILHQSIRHADTVCADAERCGYYVDYLEHSEVDNALADPKLMEAMVDALTDRYTRVGLGERIVESGVLAAQGIIWFSKVAVLRGEDYTQARDLPFTARFSPGQALA